MRVDADQWRALRQTVALQQILPGKLHPTVCNRLLNRHPAARREVQRGKVELLELFVIEQRVKQRVDASHRGKRIFRQLFHQPRNIARVSDE
ncbi:hypothetical protein D3C76_1388320 [compost metagenome]